MDGVEPVLVDLLDAVELDGRHVMCPPGRSAADPPRRYPHRPAPPARDPHLRPPRGPGAGRPSWRSSAEAPADGTVARDHTARSVRSMATPSRSTATSRPVGQLALDGEAAEHGRSDAGDHGRLHGDRRAELERRRDRRARRGWPSTRSSVSRVPEPVSRTTSGVAASVRSGSGGGAGASTGGRARRPRRARRWRRRACAGRRCAAGPRRSRRRRGRRGPRARRPSSWRPAAPCRPSGWARWNVRQPAGQEVLGDRVAGDDAQLLGVGVEGADAVHQPVHRGEHVGGPLGDAEAGGGRRRPGRRALEQLHAEPALEAAEPGAGRRLADALPRRRPREAAGVEHGDEQLEVGERRRRDRPGHNDSLCRHRHGPVPPGAAEPHHGSCADRRADRRATATADRRRRGVRRLPGLAIVAVAVAVALVAARWLDPLSPLVIAAALGALVANTGLLPGDRRPGHRLLRPHAAARRRRPPRLPALASATCSRSAGPSW